MTSMASPPAPALVVDVYESKPVQEKPKLSSVVAWFSVHWKAILAELMATCTLVLFNCMSCIPIDGLTDQSPLYNPIGLGLAVMFNTQIFGHISGAYMNPAVTLATVISGYTSMTLGICYVIVQFLGATLGYGILVGLAPIDVAEEGICVIAPHPALSALQILGIEFILTATLAFLCCSLWDPVNQHSQDSAAIKFGLTIVGLSVVGGPLTGASTNPAKSLAPSIWSGTWNVHWTYWMGPFIGSAFATIFYKTIFFKNENQHY